MKKILIVDDRPEVRELVSVTLDVGDYELVTAENGVQALAMARQHLPEVMLLDIMMPDGPSGLEVCRQLKDDALTGGIHIVMLTAKGQESDIQAGYDAGADDYLIKPFSPLQLIRKVESILGA